jgi:formylglycine-generating enzyme required for sulfatase activity
MRFRTIMFAMVLIATLPITAAAVLCKRKSGVVVLRDGCRKKETLVDLGQLGLSPDQVRAQFFAGTACQGNDPGDVMVRVGNVCVDVYEASVWSTPTGGTQYGVGAPDYPCDRNGNDCANVFARSVPGVQPSVWATWFQAQQACANVGKRLLTNAEWQLAAAGTPDPGVAGNGTATCNTSTTGPTGTGSTGDCVSRAGVRDTVGNVWEWVADWVPKGTSCPNWSYSDDWDCFAGSVLASPGALIRGGKWDDGTKAGVFAVASGFDAEDRDHDIGFRCAR